MVKGKNWYDTWPTQSWLAMVLVIALLTRLGLWAAYPLTFNNDSATYLVLGRNILGKGFSFYNATRSPGYPLFLALVGDWVYLSQLLLGILTSLLFFYIGYRISGRGWFGALAGLAHTLNLGQLFFEASLLTETLTSFCLSAALAGMLAIATEKTSSLTLVLCALFAGLAASLAGLTRPLFAFLPVLLFIYLACLRGFSVRQRLGISLAALLPALLIFGWWLNFVNSNYKMLSFDTIGGFRWLNHTGQYFEYVPDKYAVLRDTYLHYRALKIAETGTQTNAAWDAMDALQKNSKLGFYALSRQLSAISMDLIRAHPDLYLKNVLSGWWMFWWAAVYWSPEKLSPALLIPLMRTTILFERSLMILSNFFFIGASFAIILTQKARRLLQTQSFLWLALASIWATSVAQSLLDHGDNPRYLVPLQSLVILLAAWWLYQLFLARQINRT